MRAILVAFALMATVISGCLSADDTDPVETGPELVPLAIGDILVPDGAELVETATGAVLEFAGVSLPFEEDILVPAGATIIRTEGNVDADASVRAYMKDTESGRRRCNFDIVNAWNVFYTGTHTCSGMTAIDPPGTMWTVSVGGGVETADLVRVIYENVQPDGIVADLDLSQLSMPTFNLTETTGQYVPSFDETPMWIEVTLPEGEGPWPTVIASSPYNGQTGRLHQGGQPAMWQYFTQDWAKRGYAIVNMDVRGFGLSGGCVEVWSENEQRDQKFVVDWVADQEWSDGRIGFYGQSYVGTTPVAAASLGAEELDAIIAVAPVINAYQDWHFGGVPNGENLLSPVFYQVMTDMPGSGNDPVEILQNSVKGLCDPSLVVRANDPRAIYDAYYAERNFKDTVPNIKAATLYTQGFEDANVKSAMIPDWFNEIEAPKLGVFGHWVHQHPTRADEEVLFLGWMDQYVKGKDLGFDALPNAIIASNVETERHADVFPDPSLNTTTLWPEFESRTLQETPVGTTTTLVAGAATGTPPPAVGTGLLPPEVVYASYDVAETFAVSGTLHLEVGGKLDPGTNAFLGAELYDIAPDGTWQYVTYGMFNLAHENGHDRYDPPAPGPSHVWLPFLPTEWVFEANHTLMLTLRASAVEADTGLGASGQPAIFTVNEGAGPTALHMPTVPLEEYRPMALTAMP